MAISTKLTIALTSDFYPEFPKRVIGIANLFDALRAAINIMCRLLQDQNGDVVHFDRIGSVDEVVFAAVAENVRWSALGPRQCSHREYLRYLADRLRTEGSSDVKIYRTGGITTPSEISEIVRADLLDNDRRTDTVGRIQPLRSTVTLAARRLDNDAPDITKKIADEVTDSIKRTSRDLLDDVSLCRSALCNDDLGAETSNGERVLSPCVARPRRLEFARQRNPELTTTVTSFEG